LILKGKIVLSSVAAKHMLKKRESSQGRVGESAVPAYSGDALCDESEAYEAVCHFEDVALIGWVEPRTYENLIF